MPVDPTAVSALRNQDRPVVMGIVNVTPDSFSDGGDHHLREAAMAGAASMRSEGADIIDVGGESTRPGALPIDVDTELARVIPVIESIAAWGPVSIDTRKAEVAQAAIAAGACIVNDVSASLWPVAAEHQAGWIAMHMLGEPSTMQDRPRYVDVVADVRSFLVERARRAAEAGVENVWIDPGFGFGKTHQHNLTLLANLGQLVSTGVPVAVGLSRKSMIGTMLARSDGADGGVEPADRLEGSVATATHAMLQGARLIRVHDVKAARQASEVVAAGLRLRSSTTIPLTKEATTTNTVPTSPSSSSQTSSGITSAASATDSSIPSSSAAHEGAA